MRNIIAIHFFFLLTGVSIFEVQFPPVNKLQVLNKESPRATSAADTIVQIDKLVAYGESAGNCY